MSDKWLDAVLFVLYGLVVIGAGLMLMSLAVLLTQSWWGLVLGGLVNTAVMIPLILWVDRKLRPGA